MDKEFINLDLDLDLKTGNKKEYKVKIMKNIDVYARKTWGQLPSYIIKSLIKATLKKKMFKSLF